MTKFTAIRADILSSRRVFWKCLQLEPRIIVKVREQAIGSFEDQFTVGKGSRFRQDFLELLADWERTSMPAGKDFAE